LDNAVKYSDKEVQVSVAVEAPDAKNIVVRIATRELAFHRATETHFQAILSRSGRFMAESKAPGWDSLSFNPLSKAWWTVFAESEGRGHGSTFIIQLPSSKTMSAVLIVEDEQHLADGLRFNLEAEVTRLIRGRWRVGVGAVARRTATLRRVVLDVMLRARADSK